MNGLSAVPARRSGRMRIITVAFLALISLVSTGGPGAAEISTEAFSTAMRAWTQKYHVPAATLAVMHRGRLVLAEGYGKRAAGDRVPVWSLSKAITAVCVASLVEDGRMAFDSRLGPLIKSILDNTGKPKDSRLADVTIAQLLSHRSGLPKVAGGSAFAPSLPDLLRKMPPEAVHSQVLIPAILKVALPAAPGSTYQYSNMNYLLLGAAIEQVTGAGYFQVCRDRVLAHAGVHGGELEPRWGNLTEAAGGWFLSGPEYLAFMRLLMPGTPGPLHAAARRWLNDPKGKWIDSSQSTAYTLGMFLDKASSGSTELSHNGAWSWRQTNAFDGPIDERRGSLVVMTGDGTSWFAAFDGVSVGTNADQIEALHKSLWTAFRGITKWPDRDLFASFGVGPVH
jgi:CubicO group peptidase (beta-lactamase class C family)